MSENEYCLVCGICGEEIEEEFDGMCWDCYHENQEDNPELKIEEEEENE